MRTYQTILLMAGSGQRFNKDINKALIKIGGDYLFNYSLKKFLVDERCNKVFLVVSIKDYELVKSLINSEKVELVIGGDCRLQSVKNALSKADSSVIIHDAARPFLKKNDIDELLIEMDKNDAVSFYETCIDTYRINDEGHIYNLNRNNMYKIVTPQGYNPKVFNEILIASNNPAYTDELSILLDKGYKLNHIPINHAMPKLTTQADLDYITYLLEKDNQYRIGHSFDFHPFVDGDGLNLGGIFVPFTKKLKGWSDGDALLHAVTESIIGALALGDIGKLYPDNDIKYKGIDSKYFLSDIYNIMKEKGYQIVNIDAILYLEKPNLKNYKQLMANTIAEHLNISPDQVNIKATTMEQKGLVGSGDGIGAEAVTLLKKA